MLEKKNKRLVSRYKKAKRELMLVRAEMEKLKKQFSKNDGAGVSSPRVKIEIPPKIEREEEEGEEEVKTPRSMTTTPTPLSDVDDDDDGDSRGSSPPPAKFEDEDVEELLKETDMVLNDD